MSRYTLTYNVFIATAVALIILGSFVILFQQKHIFSQPREELSYSRVRNSSLSGSYLAPISFTHNVAYGLVTIITTGNDGKPLGGATYSITPIPLNSTSNYIVSDGSLQDKDKAPGTITVVGLPFGNYTVTEVHAPPYHSIDTLSRIVEISPPKSIATESFVNNAVEAQDTNRLIKGIIYTTKFECGSIFGDEGPLRPGHYDTDISIFNRQEFPINLIWNAIIVGGNNSSSIQRTLQPQTSTAIVCRDLLPMFEIQNSSQRMIGGFVTIRVPQDGTVMESHTKNNAVTATGPTPQDDMNLLDVQVFYTANALSTLPHPVLMDKIVFSIGKDPSGKIPGKMLLKILDASVPSKANATSDPEWQIKNILAKEYKLSVEDLRLLNITISGVSMSVGTMIDDHAISSLRVNPQVLAYGH
jgi:prealbumin domain-containing protein